MTSSSVTSAPIDPDPHTWLTPARLAKVRGTLNSAKDLLLPAGMWRAALVYWVRLEASLEVDFDSPEDLNELQILQENWLKKNSLKEFGLTIENLQQKLRVAPASMRWARTNWNHKLESLFLARKSSLDRASCRLLRLKDKDLVKELYHRIKAKETTFEEASRMFGQGPESVKGGLIPYQNLESMPHGLGPLLSRLEPGKLSNPLQMGKDCCLVQLETWQPSVLDKATEEYLLAEQLRLWIDTVVDTLVSILGSVEKKDLVEN